MKSVITTFLALTFLVILGLVVRAQPQNITFPVAELGNCQDETACRAYCDKPENIRACVSFAERHGLMSREEAEQARKFSDIAQSGGPGGCKTKESCETYCEDVSNIEECLNFAERHGMLPPGELAEAKKVAKALKAGAKLPGGCRGKKQCDAYCSEPSHMEECFAFAEKAGFIPPEEIAQARKVMPLMARGETPGGCRSKEQCEVYCENPDHFEECIAFAEKAGFIDPKEAAMARKTKGKGPGDCRSRESCEAYCNKPENQETCFKFATEHGLISEEELSRIKEGMGRMRAGLKQAPPEVVSCLKENLGQDIIEKIESGDLVPGPQIGETVRGCFERFMPQMMQKMEEGLRQAPPEVLTCLKETIGENVLERIKSGEAPDPEIGDKMRICFESARPQMMKQIREGLQNATPEIRQCLVSKVGPEVLGKIERGEAVDVGPEFGDVMRSCFESFRPPMPSMPPEAVDCMKQLFGPDVMERMAKGEFRPPDDLENQIRTCMMPRMPLVTPPPAGMQPPAGGMYSPPPAPQGPGGCTTAETCRQYCSDPAHFEECSKFHEFAPPPQSVLQRFLQAAVRLLVR